MCTCPGRRQRPTLPGPLCTVLQGQAQVQAQAQQPQRRLQLLLALRQRQGRRARRQRPQLLLLLLLPRLCLSWRGSQWRSGAGGSARLQRGLPRPHPLPLPLAAPPPAPLGPLAGDSSSGKRRASGVPCSRPWHCPPLACPSQWPGGVAMSPSCGRPPPDPPLPLPQSLPLPLPLLPPPLSLATAWPGMGRALPRRRMQQQQPVQWRALWRWGRRWQGCRPGERAGTPRCAPWLLMTCSPASTSQPCLMARQCCSCTRPGGRGRAGRLLLLLPQRLTSGRLLLLLQQLLPLLLLLLPLPPPCTWPPWAPWTLAWQ